MPEWGVQTVYILNQRMVDPERRNNVVRGKMLWGNLSNVAVHLFTLWLAVNVINQHENTIAQESKCPSASVSIKLSQFSI